MARRPHRYLRPLDQHRHVAVVDPRLRLDKITELAARGGRMDSRLCGRGATLGFVAHSGLPRSSRSLRELSVVGGRQHDDALRWFGPWLTPDSQSATWTTVPGRGQSHFGGRREHRTPALDTRTTCFPGGFRCRAGRDPTPRSAGRALTYAIATDRRVITVTSGRRASRARRQRPARPMHV
jgi:hypothetical protein